MLRKYALILLLCSLATAASAQQMPGTGRIAFVSKAPLETITAESGQLRGIIDLAKMNFAFTFPVKSFEGFNSPLQKEHFNEHYLETDRFPNATFTGNIVGMEGKCPGDCDITVYAKGKLMIHGITQLVTIPVHLVKKGATVRADAKFDVALADYGISIPKILEAKISPLINVSVDAEFQ